MTRPGYTKLDEALEEMDKQRLRAEKAEEDLRSAQDALAMYSELSTLSYRLRSGWRVGDALNAPEGGVNKSHSSFAEGRATGKKLTQEQVQQMVDKARDGKHTARGLGVEFGVSGSAVCNILKQFDIKLKKGRPKC